MHFVEYLLQFQKFVLPDQYVLNVGGSLRRERANNMKTYRCCWCCRRRRRRLQQHSVVVAVSGGVLGEGRNNQSNTRCWCVVVLVALFTTR